MTNTNKEALEALYERAYERIGQIETQMNATGNASPAACADVRVALVCMHKALEQQPQSVDVEAAYHAVRMLTEWCIGDTPIPQEDDIFTARNRIEKALASQGYLDSGWQPIETAPKDGTVVVVYTVANDGSWAEIGIEPSHKRDKEIETSLGFHNTHWMPLPEAPNEEK